MLTIAREIYLGSKEYSERLKLKLRAGMSHEELEKMFDDGSAIMAVVRTAERRMAKTYGCVDANLCRLDELIYM